MNRSKLVAEISCNHQGDFDTTVRMVRIAGSYCGVDVVKFQKRNPENIIDRSAPHPNPAHAFGATYYEHRKALEFSLEQHRLLKQECLLNRVRYACSGFDVDSADEIISLDPAYIKVGSGNNNDEALLRYLCHKWEGEIHISCGMTTREEIDGIVKLFTELKRNHDLTLYACTSAYPARVEDACLGEITRLRMRYGTFIKGVAFSDHTQSTGIDVAAQVLGATHIERHLTLDRTMKGTDQAASCEPEGMKQIRKYLEDVASAIREKNPEILPCEKETRAKHKP